VALVATGAAPGTSAAPVPEPTGTAVSTQVPEPTTTTTTTEAPTTAPQEGSAPAETQGASSSPATAPEPAPSSSDDSAPTVDGQAFTSIPVDAAVLPAGATLAGTTPVTTTEVAAATFHLAAVTWAEPEASLDVSVRVRSAGTWTEWQTLEPDEGGAGDGGRGGTVPLMDVAGADGVQVRVASPTGTWPNDVRIDLVDPGQSGTPTGAESATSAASTVIARPPIISRAEWGADESINSNVPSPARALNMAFVHHTATTNSYGPGDSAAQIRSIYVYHVQGRGWPDIGYNFVVDQYGQVFEGRSGGVDLPEIGAHGGDGFNTGTVGVAALGTFSTSVPALIPEAVSQVIAWKFGLHQVDPYATVRMVSGGTGNVRWGAGTEVYLPAISGHRHSSFTACPGEALFAALPSVRARVAELLAQAAAVPWLAGSLDGFRVRGGTVTAYGWSVSTEQVGTPVQIRIRSWSRSALAYTGVVRTDVAAVHPAYGSRSGFEANLDLPRGTYQVCVDVTTPGRPTVTLGCGGVTVQSGMVLGNLEQVTAQRGGASVRGWVLQPGQTASNKVHVYVDGAWAAQLTADVPRADVAAAYPAEGANHGFAAAVAIGAGAHDVCVYGISLRTSETNPLLGCRRVEVPTSAPVGHFEGVVPGAGSARLVGWTFDPETDAPLDVHLYRNGGWAGSVLADGTRTDVARAFGLAGAAHGFAVDVALPTGVQTFCTYAINQGTPATNPSLGCRAVGIAHGNPFGSLDSTSQVAGAAAGETRLQGWVIDPDTRSAAAVHVYVDGRMVGASTAGARRDDVGAAYPTIGATHGYDLRVVLAPGTHTVCVYGINTGVGTTNPLLGCRAVTA
jgi:hypothetical protein